MSELGQNGYLSQISQINSNVSAFRGLKQQAEAEQQSLNIQAKQENDMDDLRKIGSGFSEKAFKEVIGKYGGKLYSAGFGKKGSLSEFDDELGKKLGWTEAEGKDSFLKLVANKLGVDTRPMGAISDITKNLSKGSDLIKSIGSDAVDRVSAESSRITSQIGEKASNLIDKASGEASNLSDGIAKNALFSNNIKGVAQDALSNKIKGVAQEGVEMVDMAPRPPRQITPIEELVGETPPPIQQAPKVDVAGNLSKQTQMGQPDPEDLNKALDDNVSPEEFQAHLDNKYNFSGEGQEAEEGISTAVTDTADAVGAEASGAVEELVGGALEATGVLAPLGLLFQALGVGSDIYAGYETGRGVVDAFENDVLGHQTFTAPQVKMPTAPKTLLSQHLLVTPTSDTLHQQGTSFSTGW